MEGPSGAERKFTVLFVCTGNTCRSPMAEGILKARLPDDIVEWTIVESAGTMGLSGLPASDGAILVATENGLDISDHRSKGLDARLIHEADLIFAMEAFHMEWVLSAWPAAASKTHLLGAYGLEGAQPGESAVDDPIGAPIEVYRGCFATISSYLDRCSPIIERLVREKLGGSGGRQKTGS